MDYSGVSSRKGAEIAPVKRNFPVGTRGTAHQISTHLCFFCGSTFPQAADYQRHIVHEHQMASLAYQIYAEEHPPPFKGGGKEKKKEEKKEDGGRKRKDENVEETKEKRIKPDSSSLNWPLVSSQPSPDRSPLSAAPSSSRQSRGIWSESSPFATPSSVKTPILPPGRYPANKQQRKSSAADVTGCVESPSTSMLQHSEQTNGCAVCNTIFTNATDLLVHNIREHQTQIKSIQILHHYGDKTIVSDQEYKYSEECGFCDAPTADLTQSFEHIITHHKATLLNNSDANAVSYCILCEVPSSLLHFDVRVRLRRAIARS